MSRASQNITSSTKSFNPQKSIKRAKHSSAKKVHWTIQIDKEKIDWASNIERINIVRKGLPFKSIEVISKRANLPVKQMLILLQIPQTTYNKKKKENHLLDRRDGEIILVLSEVLQYGLSVFNEEEEKFHRWLKKTNPSLGAVSPESLFDSLTGIQEVRNSLNRLEYGNLA